MAYRVKTGVIGAAILPCVTGMSQSLEEVQYDVTRRALRDAGLTIDDIDGMVVGGNDEYDGRAISIMAASGSVGGVDRDSLSTPSSGEHAFVMGALQVASGHFRTRLIMAWSPTDASSMAEVQRLAADRYFHRRLPLDEVGARNKRFLRINTGGATGISSVAAAYYHIADGACDVVLAAGADKEGECGNSQTVLNKILDPTCERQPPLGTITMLAMSGIRYAHESGMTQEDMARVVVANCWHASMNPNAHLRRQTMVAEVMDSRMIAWPIRLFDGCPQSSGGGARVLDSERCIKERNLDAVWITGLGHCPEAYDLGDRMGTGATADHADAYALRNAFNRTYAMAGITDPATQIDVAEIHAPFSNGGDHQFFGAMVVES